MDIEVRKAQPADAEQLLLLVNELMGDGRYFYTNGIEMTADEYRKFIENSNLDSFTFTYVAILDQILVGWAILTRRRFKYKFHVGNLVIGIKEQFRRKGIGRKMISFIESDALRMGMESIDSFVRESNINALYFFNTLHFQKDGFKPRALKIDSQYEGEMLLSKPLI